MEEDIIKSWQKLKLTEAERNATQIERGILEAISQREKLCLLGFMVSEQMVNKEAFKSTIQTLWRLKGKVSFKEVGFNLFIIEFKENLDLIRVQAGHP